MSASPNILPSLEIKYNRPKLRGKKKSTKIRKGRKMKTKRTFLLVRELKNAKINPFFQPL